MPLHEAVSLDYVVLVELLLEHGANVHALAEEILRTPLHIAAKNGCEAATALLIQKGAIVDEIDEDGYTPLLDAAQNGHIEVVRLLVREGANVEATSEGGSTALALAELGGHKDVALFLISRGANFEGHEELLELLDDTDAERRQAVS